MNEPAGVETSFAGGAVDAETARLYREFLASGEQRSDDPYYGAEVVRFRLEDDDVVVVPPDLSVAPGDCGARLTSASARADLSVCGVAPHEARALVDAFREGRTAGEARSASGAGAAAFTTFVERTFGVVLLAPRAIEVLERRVSGTEIVRYPGSPYEIVRPYWRNMANVAERLADLERGLADVRAFARMLRELHAVVLTGDTGRSFYRPASPIAQKAGLDPGAFLLARSETEDTPSGVRFVSGPRVNAGELGGPAYHALLAESVGDPDSLRPSREVRDERGIGWGVVVTARADQDARALPWFCPPRPIESRHLEALRDALGSAIRAADGGPEADVSKHLAAFHQGFVRLHPFPAANQSVAMSIVNRVLRLSRGAGIPHLVLDHLAIRLSFEAYARAFATAVLAWTSRAETPLDRYLELARKKRQSFGFLRALGAVTSVEAARELVHRDPEGARLSMLAS